jgi:hypothetical protein
MKYRDVERPRLGDRPCWLGAPMLVLPDVVVEVGQEDQRFDARIMLAKGATTFHWVEAQGLTLTDLARLLVDWHDDPEGAVGQWFKAEVPDFQRFYEQRAKPQLAQVVVAAGDVDVEDLGL